MNAWAAFRTGGIRAFQYWQMILFLYLTNLATGLLLVVMPAFQLAEPARLTAIQDAARGIPLWMAQELGVLLPNMPGMPVNSVQALALQDMRAAISLALGGAAVVPLLAWLTGSILAGGMIYIYSEAPQPFIWKQFFWGCWHWWLTFLAFSLFQILFILVVGLGGTWIVLAASRNFSGASALTILLLAGCILLLLLGSVVIEYSRIVVVQSRKRNLLLAFIGALRFLFQQPQKLLSLYFLSGLLLLAVHLLFRVGLFPRMPLEFWPAVLLVQQVFVLARLFLRGQRLAGAAALSVSQVDVIVGDRGQTREE